MALSKTAKVVGVVMISGLGVIGVLIWYSMRVSCELQGSKPIQNTDQKSFEKFASGTSLATFNGYLEYNTTSYLPLKLNSIFYNAAESGNQTNQSDQSELKLETDCSSITISFGPINQATKIDLELRVANGNVTSCSIGKEDVKSIASAKAKHYKCDKEKAYSCKAPDGSLITKLIIQYLEFEMGLDDEHIRDKSFNTPEDNCK